MKTQKQKQHVIRCPKCRADNPRSKGPNWRCRSCGLFWRKEPKKMGRPRIADQLERELSNLQRSEKEPRKIIPWEYKPKRKQREKLSTFKARIVIEFFETQLKHDRGEWAGKPFLLDKWEKEAIIKIYGTLDEKGLRQYRETYISMAKLNGKTQFVGGLLLFHLFHDGQGTQIFCASGDREQAGLVFGAANEMLVQNVDMSNAVKISVSQKVIYNPEKRSFIKVLSHEAKTKHGIHPNVCVMDELHSWPNRHLYDVLHKGMVGQESLNLIITTSGNDKKSFGYDIYARFKKILLRESIDPRLLPIIYESDPNDDIFDIETWKKANPSLGKHRPLEKIQEAAKTAKTFPNEERTFRWMNLNQWVEPNVIDFIDMRKWDECPQNEPTDEELIKRRCWMGVDLSLRDDIVALVLVFEPDLEGVYFVYPVMFVPESMVEKRTRQGIPYQKWIDNGDLIETEGDMIDHQTILKHIFDLAYLFRVEEFVFDKYQAAYLEGEIQAKGIWKNKLIEFSQGFGGFNEVMKEFLQLVNDGKINCLGHPVLRWMAGNLVADQNWQGLLRPNKGKSKDKIDGMTALLMGLDRCIRVTRQKK
jgi:phage terminase large subunit-like protein